MGSRGSAVRLCARTARRKEWSESLTSLTQLTWTLVVPQMKESSNNPAGSHSHSTPSIGCSHCVSEVVMTSGSVCFGLVENTDNATKGAAIASAKVTHNSAKYFPARAGWSRYVAIAIRLQDSWFYASAATSSTVKRLRDFNMTTMIPNPIIMLTKPTRAEEVMAKSIYPVKAAAAPTKA